MIEMLTREESKTETRDVPQPVMLDEILSDARKLSAYDKLMLVQILVGELLREPMILLSRPKMVIELYTPYEIEGITDQMIERFESLPQPMMSQDTAVRQ